jgi:hypothetical protein
MSDYSGNHHITIIFEGKSEDIEMAVKKIGIDFFQYRRFTYGFSLKRRAWDEFHCYYDFSGRTGNSTAKDDNFPELSFFREIYTDHKHEYYSTSEWHTSQYELYKNGEKIEASEKSKEWINKRRELWLLEKRRNLLQGALRRGADINGDLFEVETAIKNVKAVLDEVIQERDSATSSEVMNSKSKES